MAETAIARAGSTTGATLDRHHTGYVVHPEYASRSGVVVLGDSWGLTGHVMSVADRFAAAGFTAFAPDFSGDPAETRPAEVRRLVATAGAENLVADLAPSTRAALGDLDTLAVIGFGFGGGLALAAAEHLPAGSGVVAFYPVLPDDWAGPTALDGKRVLLHAADELDLTATGTDAIRTAITTAGGAYTIHDYPDAVREFFNDDRPDTYNPLAATAAWARTLRFLRG